MRILHLSSLYPPHAVGGAERVVEMLAEGMAAEGLDVGVTHLVPTPTQPTLRNRVAVRPLAHRNPYWIEDSPKHSAPLRNINKIATLFNVMTAQDFSRVLQEYRPDIVHSHSMVELTPLMWQVAKAHGATLVHTLHDYDLLCIRASLFKEQRRCVDRHLACRAFSNVKRRFHVHIDHVVGVSRSILDTHLDHGLFDHVPAQRRHVVWNPVRAAAAPARRQPTERSGAFTFGFLGRLVAEKGILLLLEACKRIGPGDWLLRIAGRAPKDDLLLRERAAGLPVEFAGFVDSAEFLRSIDVLVVPSIWLEPFGLTIVEAYAAGASVLGADIAGVAEIVGAVDRAALVAVGDAQALASKMELLIAAGRATTAPLDVDSVLRAADPKRVVQQYRQIYEAALQ